MIVSKLKAKNCNRDMREMRENLRKAGYWGRIDEF